MFAWGQFAWGHSVWGGCVLLVTDRAAVDVTRAEVQALLNAE